LTGSKLVDTDEVRELLWISFANRRIFIITVGLAGDDLPTSVPPQPGIGNVIRALRFWPKIVSVSLAS